MAATKLVSRYMNAKILTEHAGFRKQRRLSYVFKGVGDKQREPLKRIFWINSRSVQSCEILDMTEPARSSVENLKAKKRGMCFFGSLLLVHRLGNDVSEPKTKI